MAIVFFLFFAAVHAFALDSEDLAALTKAGISGETIQTIIEEKVIETCAFSVSDIVDMKKSGMSDEEIRGVIRKGSFMKDSKPVVYGDGTKSLNALTPQDITALKKAGISDEVIESIVSGAFNRNDQEHERAWRMLENMGWIIDPNGGLRRR